jgi:hypothetical protein
MALQCPGGQENRVVNQVIADQPAQGGREIARIDRPVGDGLDPRKASASVHFAKLPPEGDKQKQSVQIHCRRAVLSHRVSQHHRANGSKGGQ